MLYPTRQSGAPAPNTAAGFLLIPISTGTLSGPDWRHNMTIKANTRQSKVARMTLLALLIAILVVLGYVNIPMPAGLSITFNMIPVAIAAIAMGLGAAPSSAAPSDSSASCSASASSAPAPWARPWWATARC